MLVLSIVQLDPYHFAGMSSSDLDSSFEEVSKKSKKVKFASSSNCHIFLTSFLACARNPPNVHARQVERG